MSSIDLIRILFRRHPNVSGTIFDTNFFTEYLFGKTEFHGYENGTFGPRGTGKPCGDVISRKIRPQIACDASCNLGGTKHNQAVVVMQIVNTCTFSFPNSYLSMNNMDVKYHRSSYILSKHACFKNCMCILNV